jgi:hypothetical protein
VEKLVFWIPNPAFLAHFQVGLEIARELAGFETKKAVRNLAGRGYTFAEGNGTWDVSGQFRFPKEKWIKKRTEDKGSLASHLVARMAVQWVTTGWWVRRMGGMRLATCFCAFIASSTFSTHFQL